MPRRGENIRKRKDGRWEGRYTVYDDQSGSGSLRSVYARSYAEVKVKLFNAKQQSQKRAARAATIVWQKNDEPTFGNIASLWLNTVSEKNKHSTYIKYRSIYQKYLKDSLADISMHHISGDQIRTLIPGNMEMSDSLYKSIYCVINQIFKYAEEYYQITALKVSHKKHHSSLKTIEILNRTEQAQLLRFLFKDMDIYKLGIVLCMSTGLRLGEICALKWTDIDLQEKLLYVNRTVQRIAAEGYSTKTALIESEPKSIYSKRQIPLTDDLISLLLPFFQKNGYVLNSQKPMEPRTYQNYFQKYLKEAGVPKTNFHVLRHTFATNCIDAGTDVKSLSEILGHSGVNITLNRYVHPTIATKRQHLTALSAIYGQYVGQEIR